MDDNLSTDYINYNSQGYSGFIVEPSFNAPLRKIEVCSSSAAPENDPLCFRVEGKCEHENAFIPLQDGNIPFGRSRKECISISINGRQSYSDYKVLLGCRRGGYTEDCLCKATCQEFPSGKVSGCNSNEEDANAFNPLKLVSGCK